MAAVFWNLSSIDPALLDHRRIGWVENNQTPESRLRQPKNDDHNHCARAAQGADIVHLLIIEHDDAVAADIGAALGRSGCTWHRCRSGADALIHYKEHDLLVLDLNLPDVNGLEVLRRLRAMSDVPVVVLTTRNDEREIVRALRLGADDCLAKPPRTEELLARIDVITRRRMFTTEAARRSLVKVGEFCLNLEARTITRGSDVVTLTKTEFNILALLCAECGAVIPRENSLHHLGRHLGLSVAVA